jgi:hypothetical protein
LSGERPVNELNHPISRERAKNHERSSDVNRRLSFIALMLVTVSVVIAILLPVVIRRTATAGLSALGFSESHGGAVSWGIHRTRIVGIGVGHKSTATVTVTYSAAGLIGGQFDTIEVSETELHGVLKLNGALTLDGYSTPPQAATPAGAIALPAYRVVIHDLSLVLDTPGGAVTLTGAGTLVATDAGLRLVGALEVAGGTMIGTAPAEFTLSPAGWALSLDSVHLTFPAKTDAANAIEGRLALSKSRGAAIIGEARLSGENLAIGTVALRKLSLNFQRGPQGQSGSFQFVPADGSAGIDGRLDSDASGITASVKAGIADIGPIAKAFGWGPSNGPVQANLLLHAVAGTGIRPVTLNLTYDGALQERVMLRNAKLQESGAFDPAANALTLISCGAFSADRVTMAGVALAKLSGCLGPAADQPLFREEPSGEISLASVVDDISATIPSGTATLAQLKIASFRGAASIADGQVRRFDTSVDGGAIDVPDLGAGVRDLKIKAGRAAAGGPVSGTVTASFAATEPSSPTMPIAGTLGGDLAHGIDFALTAGAPDHPPVIKLSATGQRARLDMAPTELGEGGANLLRLMPGLAPSVSRLTGTLGLHGEADWSGSAPISRGTVILKDIGATTPNFAVEGVNATIVLTSLKPLATADDQKLTIKKLLVGVPLADGEITFGFDKRDVLKIVDAHGSIAGGTVSTHDHQLDLYGPDQKLDVVVKGVDLGQLLVLMDVKGLSAQGTLEGAIPLRHTKDTMLVERGVLRTKSAGVIRYDPADPPSFLQGQPGQGTAILREALKDFHYEQLSATIDGVLGGEEQIKMSLKGANPELYGGSAIALNLNLSGALDSIARSSLEAYAHPTETVRKKLHENAGDGK